MMNVDSLNVDIRHGKGTNGQGSVQRIAKRSTVERHSATDDLRDVLILIVFVHVYILRVLSLTQDALETTGVILSATSISYTESLLLLALSLISSVVSSLDSRLNSALISLYSRVLYALDTLNSLDTLDTLDTMDTLYT